MNARKLVAQNHHVRKVLMKELGEFYKYDIANMKYLPEMHVRNIQFNIVKCTDIPKKSLNFALKEIGKIYKYSIANKEVFSRICL